VKIDIQTNFPDVARYIDNVGKQARYAAAVALNKTAAWAATDVGREMRKVFDRPTPYFLHSMRVIRASTRQMEATLWFKDHGIYEYMGEDAIAIPHIEGGPRKAKPFEKRLQAIGILPRGWLAVPGGGADLDGYGNMSRGQISLLLNVLGAYTEAGYNKANAKTIARMKAGNAKKGKYGYEYFVVPVGARRARTHLRPGVYKRVSTGFGSSLKPVLIFIRTASYKKRLDFYTIVQRTVDARFPGEFYAAFAEAIRTAI
jgi:hypothetical protein